MNNLKIAKFGNHNLSMPTPAHPGDAALDIRANEAVTLYPGDEHLVGTGFAYEPPPGYALMLLPRSGLGSKDGIVLGNLVGLIDPGYRGELKAALWYRRQEGPPITLERGERIAQLICVPLLRTIDVEFCLYDELSGTERSDGGFGSSGRS